MGRSDILGAIDIGTNGVRLKISRARRGELKSMFGHREAVRLGEGLYDGLTAGAVTEQALSRLVDVLAGYAQICEEMDARVRVVATSALREATNRLEVIDSVRSATGLSIEVIGAEEEARLTCLGIFSKRSVDDSAICIDLGGGSTEVICAHRGAPKRIFGLRLGSRRLAEACKSPTVATLRQHAAFFAAGLPPHLGRGQIGIGASGTIRALLKFAGSGDMVSIERLGQLIDELDALGPAKRSEMFESRAAVILPASVILHVLMSRLELSSIRSTKRGLRDGLLIDMNRQSEKTAIIASSSSRQ